MSIQIKTIKGFMSDGEKIKQAKITVKFTSDCIGETISLETAGVMFILAFKDVEKVIKKARNK